MKHISEVKVQVVVPCDHCEGSKKTAHGLPCPYCLASGTQHVKLPIREFKNLLDGLPLTSEDDPGKL